ncbi:MAG: YIP1 family protein [Chloroflexi bacterium]|nr:YIP1 family protein [Chloroflexota bacterium]
MLGELFTITKSVITLRDDAYHSLKASADVFQRGLVILIVVGLVVGAVSGTVTFITRLTQSTAADIAEIENFMTMYMRMFAEEMTPEEQALFENFVEDYIRMIIEIIRKIEAIPTPLPRPIPYLLEALGVFLSTPFGMMSAWLTYGLLVLIFARLLGGRSTVQQMLGLTALAWVPGLLNALGFIPCLGLIIGLVALVWGFVIYVKATAIANDMDMGKALVAVLAPVLTVLLLVILLFAVIFVLVLVTSR